MTGHHRTASSSPCFCPVTANLSSNWAGPLPRQPLLPHCKFSKPGGARAPHARPGAQTDRRSVSVRDKPEQGALRRNFRHGDLGALGQAGGKPPWGCERALRAYEDRGRAAGASALSWGGWREQTGPGRGAGGAAGARWGDEVLTELSPVGDRGQMREPANRGRQASGRASRGEDTSAETQGQEGATAQSGDSGPGIGPVCREPQCSGSKAGAPSLVRGCRASRSGKDTPHTSGAP